MKILLAIFPLMSVLAFSGQAPKAQPIPASVESFSILGIGISTTRSQVLAVLGTPKAIERKLEKEVGVGFWEVLKFDGVTIDVEIPATTPNPNRNLEPRVFRMAVTSGAWASKSGLRLGLTKDQVISILGSPKSEKSKPGITTLRFIPSGFTGFVWVNLRSNIVSEYGIEKAPS